ncbi:ABC transporter permease [Anaerolentibacter hominis]|uniref:ABC transporter permease n=1 Tax=Anaerolentibacter hominis TaxID=3079009 RepID=UPI0031B85C68
MEMNVDMEGLSTNQIFEINSRFNHQLINKVAKTEGIINYNAEGYAAVYAPELILTPGGSYNMLNMYSDKQKEKMDQRLLLVMDIMQKRPYIYGEINTEMVEYFVNGAFSLTEGRHIQEGDQGKILISDSLARNNNLKIGDYVDLEINEFIVTNYGDLDNVYEHYSLEIVGIFQVNADQEINFYTPEYDIAENYIYTDQETFSSMSYLMSEGRAIGIDKAIFAVENPEDINNIISKIRARRDIDVRNYKFGVDDSVYQSSAKPLKMISNILNAITVVIIISCLLFLIIIMKMWLSSRSREIGILMSMGVEKKGIAAEFLTEAGIMILIACCIACLMAVVTSKPISNWIIQTATPEQEVSEEKSQTELEAEMMEGNFDHAGEIIIPTQLPEEFNSMPTASDFIMILGIFLVITVGALGTTFYLFFNMTPKDILNKMS